MVPEIGETVVTLGVCSLALLLGLLSLFISGPKAQRGIILALAVLAALGTWQFVNRGDFLMADGRNRNVHVHDFSHYYFGSKYFRELGYQCLYPAVAGAFNELSREGRIGGGLSIDAVRNVRTRRDLLRGEALDGEIDACRARFSGERWSDLEDDLSVLATTAPAFAWKGFVRDSGYNPSPVFALYGQAAGLLPLDSALSLLPSIDVALVLSMLGVLWWSAGPVSALLFLCVLVSFPGGDYSTYDWIGGSFLRTLWFFWLSLAWIFLLRRKYLLGGVFFALASMERVFPFFFFLAALLPLWASAMRGSPAAAERPAPGADGSRKGAARRHALRISLGFGLAAAALFLLSAGLYGLERWEEFAGHIASHSAIYSLNNIGLKKVTLYTPEIAGSVSDVDLSSRFDALLTALSAREARQPLDRLLPLAFSLTGAAAGVSLGPALCSIYLGTFLLLGFALPAHYYIFYLAFLPALLCARSPRWERERTGRPSRKRALWVYVPIALALVGSDGFILSGLPVITTFAAVSLLLVLALVLSAFGLLMKPLPAVALFGALLLSGTATAARRAAPVGNDRPPWLAARTCEALKLASREDLPRRSDLLVDVKGYPVRDGALLLGEGDVVAAEFALPAPGARILVIRHRAVHGGVLVARINLQWERRYPLAAGGTMFDYAELEIPGDLLVAGRNTLQVAWEGAGDAGVYSAWVCTPPAGGG